MSGNKEAMSDTYLGVAVPPYLEGLLPSGIQLRLGQRSHSDLISNSNDEIRVLNEHRPPPSTRYATILNSIRGFKLGERAD